MVTEELLIQQALLGNEQAFAELVRRYWSEIFELCRRIVKNRQDAEELAQDVFLVESRDRLGPLSRGDTSTEQEPPEEGVAQQVVIDSARTTISP